MAFHCSVSFSEGSSVSVVEAKFLHAEMEHEQALVVLDGTARAQARAVATGSPVQIMWGDDARPLRSFLGYVSHTAPVFTSNVSREGENLGIHCVGASYPFKEGDYWSRRSVSATVPVREIAEQFRFDTTFIGRHPAIFPLLAQAGRSYWKFMAECARRLGWTLYVHGTTLYCHERTAALALSRGVPLFMSADRSPNGRLLRFRNSVGATSPEGGQTRNRHVYGVNPRTGSVLQHTNKANTTKPLLGNVAIRPVFGQGEMAMPVDSLAEAHDLLQGQELGNRLAVEATMEAGGDQNLQVGRAVAIDGLSALDNGYWYVKSYVQTWKPSTFQAEVVLGRDSASGYNLPPSPTPKYSRGSRLVNGRWVLA